MFNIKNTVEVIKTVNNILFNGGIRLVSFDIKNAYPNIPTEELTIITNMNGSYGDLK